MSSQDNKIIYLYVKTHSITGLKYFGMTCKDPFKYSGSGLYWKRHLKIYGKNHKTEIIKECKTSEEIKIWGTYYSELWNIVESQEWANIKPETGQGAPFGKYHHYKNQTYDKTRHPNWGKKHKESTIEKNRLKNSGVNNPNYGKIWINNGIINNKIEQNEEIPTGWIKGRIFSEKHKKTMWDRDRNGQKNPKYDFTLRKFIHVSGIEEVCTQRELIIKYNLRESCVSMLVKGKLKSTAGWRLINE